MKERSNTGVDAALLRCEDRPFRDIAGGAIERYELISV
jgi:hypothetical protein